MLSADLSGWAADFWLVLDDYQELTAAPAEDFVESLLIDAPLNVLLLTRRRPRWASSRRILYGEIFELDRSAIAMSDEEARTLLGSAGATTNDVVGIARGWPAVLALAAVLDAQPPELFAAPQLYRFFADEIYRRLDPHIRQTLCELALYDVDGRQIVLQQIPPEDAHYVVEAGLASGFLTERSDGKIEVHPLVRRFLQRKLSAERPTDLFETIDRAVRTLLENGLWDEAFALIRAFDREDLIPILLEAALDDLLATGRTTTLESWIGESPPTAPIAKLAIAELAFREGRFYESEALAALAAKDLADNMVLAARANFVAGRAAHVASRETQAHAYYGQARTLAEGTPLERRAAFGELVATIELEDPRAAELLTALTNGESSDPGDQVILADRKLAYETRFGAPVDLQSGRAASQLLRFVTDPVARASFRNVFGYALASTAHFDEATELTEAQMKDAERCRLDFVVPYALTI
ncbi:MAG: hypothetical protein ACXWZ8_07680, partial [Gaiellaceae bacterium]